MPKIARQPAALGVLMTVCLDHVELRLSIGSRASKHIHPIWPLSILEAVDVL
jgi:hypothetical protein